MKKFILFAGEYHYPGGGMEDFKGSYDTIDEAKHAFTAIRYLDWYHVVERDTWTVVASDDKKNLVRINKTIWEAQ